MDTYETSKCAQVTFTEVSEWAYTSDKRSVVGRV